MLYCLQLPSICLRNMLRSRYGCATRLISKLGVTDSDVYGTAAITYYINKNVSGGNLRYFDPGGNAALICKE